MEADSDAHIALLKSQLKDCKSKLAVREKELSYFRKQIETVQEDHENLCKAVASLKSSSVIQENAILKQQNEQLIKDFDLLERRVNEVAATHLLDQQEKEMMTFEIDRLHEENERKTADRQRTIEIYEERLEKLRAQVKSEEHENEQLRMEVDFLRQAAEDHAHCAEERTQLQAELAELREVYEAINKEREPEESDFGATDNGSEALLSESDRLEAGDIVETEYERMKAEIAQLHEKLMEADVEKHLWKKSLQHSLIMCAPAGKKTEAQKLAEEVDDKCEDLEFVARIPQRVSELCKEVTKSPLATARYSSPRPTSVKRDGTLSLRVVATLQRKSEGRELFESLDQQQIKFIGGSKEAERLFRVDAVHGEKTANFETEITAVLGKGETSPVLILIAGAQEQESSVLFSLCVRLSLSNLLSTSSDISFALTTASDSSLSSLFPDVAVSFNEDKGELPMAKLHSVEQVERIMREKSAGDCSTHRVLAAAAENGVRCIYIVEMAMEERTGQDVVCKVLSALYAQRHHVPFRNSPLTTLLRPCLLPDLRLLAILSVHQTAIEESLKVLQFGSDLLAQRDFAISRQRALALKLPSQTLRPQSASRPDNSE